jgi:hypothetical protein
MSRATTHLLGHDCSNFLGTHMCGLIALSLHTTIFSLIFEPTHRFPFLSVPCSLQYSGLGGHVTLCASHDPGAQTLCLHWYWLQQQPLPLTNKLQHPTRCLICCCLFVFVSAGLPALANKGSCPKHGNSYKKCIISWKNFHATTNRFSHGLTYSWNENFGCVMVTKLGCQTDESVRHVMGHRGCRIDSNGTVADKQSQQIWGHHTLIFCDLNYV